MRLWRGSGKRAWTRRAMRGTWICGSLVAFLTQDLVWDWSGLYPWSASLNIFVTRLLFPVLSTESIPKGTTQGVKDFFCFDIPPGGGREIVSRKRNDNGKRKIAGRTPQGRFLQRTVLCRGKYFFLNSRKGLGAG